MKRLAFAIPGDLATATGGYAYDRRMIAELQKLGWQVDVIELGDGFPRPSSGAKAAAADQLRSVPEKCPIVIDGLAFGVLPEVAAELRERNPLVALVHHPLAYETGLLPETVEALHKSEKAALETVRAVIVTSPATATLLTDDYEVPPELITVVIPGIDHRAAASGSRDGTTRFLAVGAVVPRKGFDVLIAALAEIKDQPWQLTIAGDRTRDPVTAEKLDADIAQHGLGSKVNVRGAVSDEEIAALYASSDVFVLPSRFEGYGMAYAEALAHGLPVIGTTAGAIPDTVPPDAGILVEPNDVTALVRALRMMIGSSKERDWLAAGARTAGAALPGWAEQAGFFADAIEPLS